MDVLQTWALVGVPGVIVAGALFAGHDRVRALFGYAILAGLTGVFLTVDGGAIWGGVIGLAAVGLVATGRGSTEVETTPEEQVQRDRLTRVEQA